MGISPELLSDAALNVAGYLLAGALLTLLYSTLTHRTSRKNAPVTVSSAPQSPDTPATSSARRAEYVDLRNVKAPDNRPQSTGRSAVDTQTRQRNRAEVMRLAREMLQSGTPRNNVRNLLPISEGELAMLENQRA